MALTFVRLATIVANGSTGLVEFLNIPQTYTDLKLYISARTAGTSNNQGYYIQFSGNGSSVYSFTDIRGVNTTISSARGSTLNSIFDTEVPNASSTAEVFGNAEVYMPSYSQTTGFKQVLISNAKENNSIGTNTMLQIRTALWRSSQGITQISIGSNLTGPNFINNSEFTLYGIKNT